MMGLLGGGYHPAAPPIISSLVEQKNRGQALGMHMIGGSASYFIAPIIAAVIAVKWGWRGSFIALAAPTIVFGVVLYLVLGQRVGARRKESGRPVAGGVATQPGHIRHLVAFIVLSTATGAVFISIISFVPLYLVDKLGVAEETAGALLGLIYSAGLWVGPLAGHLSDRLGRVPMMLAICFAGGPVIYLIQIAPYGWSFFGLLIAVGIIMYVRMPVTESYIVGQTTPRNRSTVLGMYYFGAMEGGGVLTPVIGYLIDRVGFFLSFTITGAMLVLITFVCSLILWSGRDR
jgi:MFS family permease